MEIQERDFDAGDDPERGPELSRHAIKVSPSQTSYERKYNNLSTQGEVMPTNALTITPTTVQRALGAVVGRAVALTLVGFEPSATTTLPADTQAFIRQLVVETNDRRRDTSSFAHTLTEALEAPHATVSSVELAGIVAGAQAGVQGIPSRFTQRFVGGAGRPNLLPRLHGLGHEAIGVQERPETPPEPAKGPVRVHDAGVYAANLAGAAACASDLAIVTLCRGGDLFGRHGLRHELYLIDDTDPDLNPALYEVVDDAVTIIDSLLAAGRSVVVHCHGGRSRTALVLKAWYMRRERVKHATAHRWLCNEWTLTSDWNHRFTDFLDDEWSIR